MTVLPIESPKKLLPAWVSVVAVWRTTVASRKVHIASTPKALASDTPRAVDSKCGLRSGRRKGRSHTWLHGDCFVGYPPTEEGGQEGRSDLHNHINDGIQPTDLVPAAHPHGKRDRCQCGVVVS
jgi:hypothetical protein